MSAESPGGPATGDAPDWPPDCAGDWAPDCAPSGTEPGTTATSDPRTSDRRRAVRIMLPPAMRTTRLYFPRPGSVVQEPRYRPFSGSANTYSALPVCGSRISGMIVRGTSRGLPAPVEPVVTATYCRPPTLNVTG